MQEWPRNKKKKGLEYLTELSDPMSTTRLVPPAPASPEKSFVFNRCLVFRWLVRKKNCQKLIFLTWPSFSVSPLTDPVSVGAILFSALNCEQTYSLFPFSLNFSRRSHPVTVVGEADGDDDEDEDRDDGHHHHVGGEQSCQVIWCSAEKKTVNNMKSYTQQACNIEKSLAMNEKGKSKNNPKLQNITHTHSHIFLLSKAQRTSISYVSFCRFDQYRQL